VFVKDFCKTWGDQGGKRVSRVFRNGTLFGTGRGVPGERENRQKCFSASETGFEQQPLDKIHTRDLGAIINSRWLPTLPGTPKEHKKRKPLRLGIEINERYLPYYPGA